MALTTIQLHGEILTPVTDVPAVGTVTFKILQDLRDTTTNIVYSPMTFVATLDVNGEFLITLPTTDSPDITPLNWTYWVYVDTDVWTSGVFYIALPAALGPVAEFADIIPILSEDCTPDGTACAPISLAGEVAALADSVEAMQEELTDLAAEVATFSGAITDLQDDMAALEAEVATFSGDIADLQADVTALQGDVNTLDITVTALVNQVNILTPQVATNTTNIGTLQGQMATVQGQITTIQGQITTIGGQITTLQGQVATLITDLDTLELAVVYRNPVTGAVYVGNTVTGPDATGSQPWLKSTPIPYSAPDSNFDFLRIIAIDEFGNQVQTFVLNGNGEPRSRPSKRDRVGSRAFESAQAVGYSTGQFWQASSNPTAAASREPYLGVWGTAATKPGWAEGTRVVSGLQGVSAGGTVDAALAPYNTLAAINFRGLKGTVGAPSAGTWLLNDVVLDSIGTFWRCSVAGTPGTWVADVPTKLNVTSFTGTTASAALISDGAATGAPYVLATNYDQSRNRVTMDGAISNTGGVSIAGGTVLFNVNALHVPTAWVQFNERTSTTLSARVTIKPDGTVRLDQPLAAGATCSFDGLNWAKV